jgi:peptidoglycan/xylan/chitin deacetylase (PgdA/CDA1 family)/lipoprotein-anchoring transpeptidase ErfK/SrfK
MRRTIANVVALAVLGGSLAVLTPSASAAALPPSEWVIGPQARIAMLTFDGQMRAKHLAEILDILEQKSVKATFFISGRWIRYHQDKARAIVKAGHVLGNRGYGTETFTSLSETELRASITQAQEVIAAVGGTAAPYLRAPKGARSLGVLRTAGSMGYRSVRWTYRPGGGAASAVRQKLLRHAQAGAIYSLEPWRKSHRTALAKTIKGFREKGFGFRTVDALQNAHAVRWDVTLKPGSSGSEVKYLQRKLNAISYPAGKQDGEFGYATQQAVYAYEKYNGLARDSVVTVAQMLDIAKAQRPAAPKVGRRNFVYVDVSKQILLEVRKSKVTHTLPVSTGNEEYYEVDGQRYKAHTPRGNFRAERKIYGKRVSRLGTLYDPVYFIGGYAVHGSPSVPTYPASHGCVRIPMYLSRKFYNRTPIGMPFFVVD